MGSTTSISEILRDGKDLTDANQMHDILLTYHCGDQWTIHASKEPKIIHTHLLDEMVVDPETCKPI